MFRASILDPGLFSQSCSSAQSGSYSGQQTCLWFGISAWFSKDSLKYSECKNRYEQMWRYAFLTSVREPLTFTATWRFPGNILWPFLPLRHVLIAAPVHHLRTHKQNSHKLLLRRFVSYWGFSENLVLRHAEQRERGLCLPDGCRIFNVIDSDGKSNVYMLFFCYSDI